MRLTLQHEVPCSPAAFWELYLDPTFMRAFWMEKAESAGFDLLTDEATPAGERRRRFRVTIGGGLEIPGPVAKLIGGPLAFTEEGLFKPEPAEYVYHHTYSALTERVKVKGRITAHPAGSARATIRVVDLDIDVKVFGLGGLIEKAAEKNFRWGFDAHAAFVAEWLRRSPAPSATIQAAPQPT